MAIDITITNNGSSPLVAQAIMEVIKDITSKIADVEEINIHTNNINLIPIVHAGRLGHTTEAVVAALKKNANSAVVVIGAHDIGTAQMSRLPEFAKPEPILIKNYRENDLQTLVERDEPKYGYVKNRKGSNKKIKPRKKAKNGKR